MASRILFFVAGIVALSVAVIITLGAALAGALSIGIIAYLMSRRGRRLTRRGAWLASVGGTVGVLAVITGLAVVWGQSNQQPMTATQRAEQRAQAKQAVPDWMKAINPSAERRTAAADSVATKLLENKAVVVWAGLMGAVIASLMIGTIAGSFAWGGVMLLYRGVKGDWLPGSAPGSGL